MGRNHHFGERRHRRAADWRLARIEGHVGAIRRMIDEERACPDLLKDHRASCIASGREEPEKASRDFCEPWTAS